MRRYAGLEKDAVHIGGSVYDKNGAEKWVQIRDLIIPENMA